MGVSVRKALGESSGFVTFLMSGLKQSPQL